MRFAGWVGAVALAGGLAAVGWSLPHVNPSLQPVSDPAADAAWTTGLDDVAALERGAAESRPVLVYFHADWCGPCHELELETFPTPLVRGELARFVLVRIDVTDRTPAQEALQQKYGVRGLPAIVLVDSKGGVRDPLLGFLPARALARALRQID